MLLTRILVASLTTLLLPGAATAQDKLREEYTVSFDGGRFDNRQLQLVGDGAASFVAPTAEGLRIRIPRTQSSAREVGFAPRFTVHGDFEIVASYKLIKLNDPDRGYGVGPSIYIDTVSADKAAATVARIKRPKEGDIYNAHNAWTPRNAAAGEARKQSVRFFKTDVQEGKLRLVRSGKKLRYFVSEGGKGDFRQIREVTFTGGDVRLIRVSLSRNGAGTPAEVLWKDFTVRAEAIQRESGKDGALWGVAVMTGVLLLAAMGGWWRYRNSHAARAGEVAE